MLTGLVVFEGQGWWIVECDNTSEAVFTHHSKVLHNRYLHVGDRVRFESEPNPRKPGQNQAINVQFIGHVIARQTSGDQGGVR
jgi:cold shock CspA family protein